MRQKKTNRTIFFTAERAALMICIGIAFCFWVLNRLSSTARAQTRVNIAYTLPPEKAFSIPPPQYITVQVQGTGWRFLLGRDENIRISLNSDSIQIFPIKKIIQQQLGNDLIGITDENLVLQTENIATRNINIKPISQFEYANGYYLSKNITLDPATVAVSGPKSVVEKLEYIETTPIMLKNVKGTSNVKVKLAPNPILKYDIEEVNAEIVAEQFTEKKLFVNIVSKNLPPKTKVFPSKIRLECNVALSKYIYLTESDFTVEADFTDINPKVAYSNNALPIIITKQPNFVTNVRISPKIVQYFFEKN